MRQPRRTAIEFICVGARSGHYVLRLLEHATEPLLAANLPRYGHFFRWINRHVADALVGAALSATDVLRSVSQKE